MRITRTLGVLAVVFVLGSAATGAGIRTSTRGAAAAEGRGPAVAGGAVPAVGESPLSARVSLGRLADSITAVPADSATGYAYHHQRRWILDTTGTPAVRANSPAVVAVDIQRWEAGDGSGRGVDVEIGPDYTLAGADPQHRSTDAEFANGHIARSTYAAGHRRSPIAGPPASDRAELARQLAAVARPPDGPQATLHGVDELYTSHYVPLPVRRAVLRVLADIVGLRYHRAAVDRLGRAGVAVSLTNRGVEYTLTFDPVHGRLLASEQRSVAAHEHLDVPHGLIRYHTLFVEQARRQG